MFKSEPNKVPRQSFYPLSTIVNYKSFVPGVRAHTEVFHFLPFGHKPYGYHRL